MPLENQTSSVSSGSVSSGLLAPLPFAAALASLRNASAAVESLRTNVASSHPIGTELVEVGETIRRAHRALLDCVQGSQ
ncbi:MAG TPA: hypothetical protein VEI83_08670 [Acidimicrobiales bacterium]|nr:hypothetical protein [Acidimicrobiales bacterium]